MEQAAGSPPQGEARRPGPGQRPRSYKTEAVVLRAFPVLEADRLVTVLTPSLGKLKVTVRGARRITSRLGGHLDVLNRVSLTLALGHRFDVVTGAESAESFASLKGDLDRLASALYLSELVDGLLPEAAPHPAVYDLLLAALRALDGAGAPEAARLETVLRYVELRLLDDAGYMPELQRCLVCGTEIEEGHHRYAPALGGTVDERCVVTAGRVLPLSVDALKVLRHFARTGFAEATRLRLGEALDAEIEGVLGFSLQHVLEREMGTAGFIEHLRTLRRGSR
ncbi:MAG: DNA repair protein RecO [Chloroflexi bacterium]|nr:DNA repair protein RecO [Chloroflexota bacterium]MCH7655181.1 DNA repair protein RecO [Chloroflexota bacterium]